MQIIRRQEKVIRNLLLGLLFAFAFNAMPIDYADEQLPKIAPVDEQVLPPLDALASKSVLIQRQNAKYSL